MEDMVIHGDSAAGLWDILNHIVTTKIDMKEMMIQVLPLLFKPMLYQHMDFMDEK